MGEDKARRRVRKRRSLSFLLAASKRRETSIWAILRDDPKFRIVFTLLILGGLAIAAMLPKVWITTPKGFDPVVRVSGLDLLQTRSLMRTARKQEAAGKNAEAAQAWASAVANNAGDATAIRGLLGLLSRDEKLGRRWIPVGIGQSQWLLRLNGTNQMDVDLSAAFYRKSGLHELSIRLLSDTNRSHTAVTAAALAAAYFETARMDAFARHWQQHESLLKDDPELALMHAAWAAVWGPPAGITEGLRLLNEAAKDRTRQTQALQLLLIVQTQRLDLEGFNSTFAELQSLRADRLQDHARHWLLLHYLGQPAVAVEKARAYAVPPQTVTEADILLNAWNRIGAHDLAVDFARQQMQAFPNAAQLWLLIGRMLVAAQRWDDLRAVAVEMRNRPAVARLFGGYTHFLEGVAEHGLEHRARADDCFREMLAAPPEETLMAFEAGTTLQKLGYNEAAQTLFKRLESALGGKVEFWQRMAQSAHEIRDAQVLLNACEKAYQLAPANPVLANNYAAALLISRSNPAEAVRITMDVVNRSPDSAIARINHALALAQNGRFTEARQALDALAPDKLTPVEKSFWHLGQLECALGQNDPERALRHIDLVEHRFLFPTQSDWITQARARLVRKPA